jgi:hypothetical protein
MNYDDDNIDGNNNNINNINNNTIYIYSYTSRSISLLAYKILRLTSKPPQK